MTGEPNQRTPPAQRIRPSVVASTTEIATGTATPLHHPTPTPSNKPKHAKLSLEVDHGDEGRKVLRCPACSSNNPPDAFYCHFDGQPLFKDLQAKPLHVGSLPFPTPFCFSTGHACTNFNQLALGCNNNWEEARELLTQGIWTMFFAAMGRLDLSAASKQAAQEPDPDRGLSQLLGRLPADAEFLAPPKLALDLEELDLGQLQPGVDYTFDLVVRNRGMLFLHGVAFSNFDWLVFPDEVQRLPTTPSRVRACQQPPLPPDRHRPTEKTFQTRHGCTIPVRILGSKLRAGVKPLLGEVVVDANGGAAVLPVRASIPVRPFPNGYASDVLAGVRSPRHLAVRAKKFPKEACLLFEEGAVKAWYISNGWTYPIEQIAGQGVGAVQQFFEALGLTTPPRLEIDTGPMQLRVKAGESVSILMTVRTHDGKPVYARAWSDRDCVTVGPIRAKGAKVQIPLTVVTPSHVGTTVEAQVIVEGNGKQRFVVPIAVTATKR